MTTNLTLTCAICAKQTDRNTCQRCTNRISSQLADILTYLALAEDELTPGRGGDGRSTERSIGLRIEALNMVMGGDIIATLESWERVFREDWDYSPYGPASLKRNRGKANQVEATLTGIVRFHRTNLDRIAEHPAVDEFAREVGACWSNARDAANQQPRQAWRVTCPADTDEGECGHHLRVTGQDFGGQVLCNKCRTHWHTDRLLMVVATSQEADLWIDVEAAARHTNVPEATLRRYAKEGKITKRGSLYEYKSLAGVVRSEAG
jgi:hypothetical protein